VAREVGKVGNEDPLFVIPLEVKKSKGSIKNFFAKAGKGVGEKSLEKGEEEGMKTEKEEGKDVGEDTKPPPSSPVKGIKREADTTPLKGEPPSKKTETAPSPSPSPTKKYTSPVKPTTTTIKGKISATKNVGNSPVKSKAKAGGGAEQSLKITHFFGK